MADDISVRVQRLIEALRAARAEMANGSKEAERLDKYIERLGSAFQRAQPGGYEKITVQLQKFVDLVDAGISRTLKLNGEWANTAPLIRAVGNELAKIQKQPVAGPVNYAEKIAQGPGDKEAQILEEGFAEEKKRIDLENTANEKQIAILREHITALKERARLREKEMQQYVQFGKEQDKATKKEKEQNAVIEERRKLYASLGSILPGGADVAARVKQRASFIDPKFDETTLKRVESTGEGGIFRSTFEYKAEEGYIKRLSLVTTQYGEVLVDTQKRFRTFGSEIGRNILEFTKWSIAVAAVYTPLQKLSELVSIAIDNQTKLADITVVVGNTTKSVSEIFDAAAQIAQQTGETLNGTLEAYSQAYKAAGGAATSTERFNNANQLLVDSLILSKLSTLSEAEAIDTLSAALRQSNLQLTQGATLLDKWVSVSKVANVDVGSLATGFGIVADAAESAGVDADKLNAILGVLAETGLASSKELGNQAKALIAGMQSDQAQKALGNLGIATKSVTGDMRGFFDVLSDIQQARESGALSDTQLSKLTLALGGGTRRQNIWQTIIEQSEKLNKIELTSKFANSGTAAEAMGKKLETVNTATTKLSNSFQELAQSLGTEGGILDITTLFLNTLNGIVKGLAEVTAAAGKAGPVLIAALAAGLLLSRKPAEFTKSIIRSVGTTAGNVVSAFATTDEDKFVTGKQMLPNGRQQTNMMSMAGIQTRDWFMRSTPILGKPIPNSDLAASAATALFPAIFNSVNEMTGKDTLGWEKAGASLGGAAIGALVSAGNPIGVAIGSVVGESFISVIEANKPKFSSLLTFKQKPETTTETGGTVTEEDRVAFQQSAIDELTKLVKGVTTPYEGRQYSQLAFIKDFELNQQMQSRFAQEANRIYGTEKYSQTGKVDIATLSKEDVLLAQAVYGVMSGQISEADFSGLIAKLNQAYGTTETSAEDRAITASTKIATENEKVLNELRSSTLGGLRSKLGTGDITTAEYTRRSGLQEGANLTLGRWEAAFGDLSFLAGNVTEDLTKLNDVLLNAPEDTITYFTTLATSILDSKSAIAALTPGTEEYTVAVATLNDYLAQANALLAEQNKNFYANVPDMQQLQLVDYSKTDIKAILKRAEELANEALLESGASQAEIGAKNLDITFINVWDGTKFIKTPVMKDSLNYVSLAETELEQAGVIEKPSKQSSVGFSTYDVTSSELRNLVNGENSQYEKLKDELVKQGYTLDEQTDVAITSEGALSTYTKDWKIVQYLLQQILDTEKDQLEGFYNFPADMFPYIPVTPGLLEKMKTGTGGTSSLGLGTEETPSTRIPVEGPGKKKGEAGRIPIIDPEAEAEQKRNAAWSARLNAEWEAYQKRMQETETITGKSRQKGTDITNKEQIDPLTLATNSIVESIMKPIEALIQQLLGVFNGETPTTSVVPGGLSNESSTNSLASTIGTAFTNFTQTALKNLSTRLSLNINNRMVLQVNGRVLAEVVRPYLKDELVRYSNTGGSTVSANVV